jgi:hypothetical protein
MGNVMQDDVTKAAGWRRRARTRRAGAEVEAEATESGVLVADGRWYFITYPFRSYDGHEARVELVDIGPVPAQGVIARIEGSGDAELSPQTLVCPGGVVPAELALALLSAAGVQLGPVDSAELTSLDQVGRVRPHYQEAAQLLLEDGRPLDGPPRGSSGSRACCSNWSQTRSGHEAAAVLEDIVKNLVLGIEDPEALIPD